jgi:hypothetical protein
VSVDNFFVVVVVVDNVACVCLDLIQNRGYQELDYDTFVKRQPHTYLVHGKGIVAALKKRFL